MVKKKQQKVSIVAQIEDDPVASRVLSLFRPHFDEVQYIVLLVALLFAPIDGAPLVRSAFEYLWSLALGSTEQHIGLLQFIFILAYVGGLLVTYAWVILRKKQMSIGQKTGTLMIVYFTIMQCAVFGSLIAEKQGTNQGIVNDFNLLVIQVVQWVLLIRFFTTWIAAHFKSRRMMTFLTKNFSDRQVSLNAAAVASLCTLFAISTLYTYDYNGFQTVALSYVYGYALYKLLTKLMKLFLPKRILE